jgi:hypothetical protein
VRLRPCANGNCGALVDPELGGKKYCSNGCRQKAWRDRHPKAYRLVDARISHCLNCGKSYCTHQPMRRFCKVSCRVSFWQQQKRLNEKENLALQGVTLPGVNYVQSEIPESAYTITNSL